MLVQYIKDHGGVGRAVVPGYHVSDLLGTDEISGLEVALTWATDRGMWQQTRADATPAEGSRPAGSTSVTDSAAVEAVEVAEVGGDPRALAPEPCRMTHTPPFDFAECATHDETFPLGQTCRFDGRDPVDVFAEEADQQRQEKVLAQMESEQLADELAQAREALAALTGEASTSDAGHGGPDWSEALAALLDPAAPAMAGRLLPGWSQLLFAVRPALPATATKARELLRSAGLVVVGSGGPVIYAAGDVAAWRALQQRAQNAPSAAAVVRWVGPSQTAVIEVETALAVAPAATETDPGPEGWSLCLHPVAVDGAAVNVAAAGTDGPHPVLSFVERLVTSRDGTVGRPRPSGGLTWVPVHCPDEQVLRYLSRLLPVRSLRREARIVLR